MSNHPQQNAQHTPRNNKSGHNWGKKIVAFFKGGNTVVKTILLLAIGALILLGLGHFQKQGWGHKKINRSITNTITEIKKIKEFCTANYCDETIVTATRKRRIGQDEIAIVVKGTVRAGFNLEEMNTVVKNDTSIVVVLPKAQVLDVITNPSDCETFVETGRWTPRQVTKYKEIARQRIRNHAETDGLLKDAEEHGKERLRLLFFSMGFKDVTVVVEE